jgi:probable rRNA maturation factor
MIELQFSDSLADAQQLKRLLSAARVRRWVNHALLRPHDADQITVRVVGSKEARELNRDFRGKLKDYPTNVLTFDYQHTPFVHADLLLCAPVIAQEARAQAKNLEAHWAHLIIHGILHAQGYEHETNEKDALEMEALEIMLMYALGYPNPY